MKQNTTQLKTLIFTVFMAFGFSASAQEHNEPECGTTISAKDIEYIQSIRPELERYEQEYFALRQNRSSTAITSIPIKAHIIRSNSGSSGLSEIALNNAIDNLNDYYKNAFMEFYICDGINYIDNSDYVSFDTSEEAALTGANNVSNLINIYFATNVTSGTSNLCGYAYLPGGPDVIIMKNTCATNGSTLIHEVGHFFSLLHTHGPSNDALTSELADGSNCDTDGDFICDTPADPQLGYGNVNVSCNYVGNDVDANGDDFNPDETNIMSYSPKECRDYLSSQQYARIYAAYHLQRNYYSCASFNIDVSTNYTRDCSESLSVAFNENGTGATSWEWDVDGDDVVDYTTQNPNHTYTSNGLYDVTVKVSNGTETLTRVYANLISFNTNAVNTSKMHLTLNTDNWPAETSWEFRDGSTGNILYAFGPYAEPADDFTTFNYEFDVVTGNCYEFEIFDTYGDGLAGSGGVGSYELKTDDDTIIASGTQIGFGESTFISNMVLSNNDYFIDNLSLYPNPATERITLKLSKANELPDSYAVYNMLGQLITEKSINATTDLTLNTAAFNQGMYFIKVRKDNQTMSLPFIKQ
ncbi:MAG: T9SS type A sorting domain-containing protein [Flavobacteriaceae bacterium]|nr:T9SS type A sorting domain-containing protein [Flavobacteriaceae bacterium]